MNYIMQEVYDNPRTTTNNHVELARRAKVSENQAKHFLKKQAVNQIEKIKKKFLSQVLGILKEKLKAI